LLSIIIPVYNIAKLLPNRLEHLLQHNLESVQIIVVDDGSTDCSYEICQQYLSNYAAAVLITQKNQGLSAARNRGIAEAKGEYVLFLDSDDILMHKGFRELMDYICNNKPDILMGKYVVIQKKGRDIWPQYSFPSVSSEAEAKKMIYTHITDSIWNAWRYVCRREFLIENNLFFQHGILCEDMEWSPRVLEVAANIAFLEEPFYGYYHNRPGSITSTALAKRIADVNTIVANSVIRYSSKDYGKALSYRLVRESFYCISRYFLCKKSDRKALRPIIEKAIDCYHHSASGEVALFLQTQPIIPLYIWSVILWIARKTRKIFNPILGPISIKNVGT